MSATDVRSRDRVGVDYGAAPAGQFTDSHSEFMRSKAAYTEELERSRRRKRVATYSVCGSLWALAAVPLAREIVSSGGANAVLVYIAVAAVSLGIAVASRWVYVQLTRATLLSPLVFLIAAVLAIASYGIQTSGEPQPSYSTGAAETQGQGAF